MKNITTSRPCPNCERLKKKRSWVEKTKNNKYFCPQCGSNYSSLVSIK